MQLDNLQPSDSDIRVADPCEANLELVGVAGRQGGLAALAGG